MINLYKINKEEIEAIVDFLYLNRTNLKKVISEFGTLIETNKIGTYFLKPQSEILNTLWITEKNENVYSLSLGGQNLSLSLKKLSEWYPHHKEGFIPYDDEYNYTFYKNENYQYLIKITSKDKLFEGNNIIENISITGLQIILENSTPT